MKRHKVSKEVQKERDESLAREIQNLMIMRVTINRVISTMFHTFGDDEKRKWSQRKLEYDNLYMQIS